MQWTLQDQKGKQNTLFVHRQTTTEIKKEEEFKIKVEKIIKYLSLGMKTDLKPTELFYSI
jgi:hypothetical protein